MDAQLFILTLVNDACREMKLHDNWRSPSWTDGQCIRACVLRLERGDASAWLEFQERLDSDRELTVAVRSILLERYAVFEVSETQEVTLNLPPDIELFSIADEERFLRSLNVWDREPLAVFSDPSVRCAPQYPHLYKTGKAEKFLAPSKKSHSEIMYIEMKSGLAGPARIGRVTFSNTRKTIYYDGRKLQSLNGSGYKANFYNVESGMWYWVSKCRKDGNDALYPATIEIDDVVREEYWAEIRQEPENKHLTKFRSPGKYSKRKPC